MCTFIFLYKMYGKLLITCMANPLSWIKKYSINVWAIINRPHSEPTFLLIKLKTYGIFEMQELQLKLYINKFSKNATWNW